MLTATLLPEPERAAGGVAARLVPFPRVHVSEVMGLLDHVADRAEGGDSVFDIAEELGVDYDRMTSVVRAAEQLGWVVTPGDDVRLDARGSAAGGRRQRRAEGADAGAGAGASALRAGGRDDQGERRAIEVDEVLADLTICFPFSRANGLLRTVIEWGRYAEVLDHESRNRRLVLPEEERAALEAEADE